MTQLRYPIFISMTLFFCKRKRDHINSWKSIRRITAVDCWGEEVLIFSFGSLNWHLRMGKRASCLLKQQW